jgi:hypothetical protein
MDSRFSWIFLGSPFMGMVWSQRFTDNSAYYFLGIERQDLIIQG